MDIEQIADDLRNWSKGYGVYNVGVVTAEDGTRSIDAPLVSLRQQDHQLGGSVAVEAARSGQVRIVIADESGATRVKRTVHASAEAVRTVLVAEEWALVQLEA